MEQFYRRTFLERKEWDYVYLLLDAWSSPHRSSFPMQSSAISLDSYFSRLCVYFCELPLSTHLRTYCMSCMYYLVVTAHNYVNICAHRTWVTYMSRCTCVYTYVYIDVHICRCTHMSRYVYNLWIIAVCNSAKGEFDHNKAGRWSLGRNERWTKIKMFRIYMYLRWCSWFGRTNQFSNLSIVHWIVYAKWIFQNWKMSGRTTKLAFFAIKTILFYRGYFFTNFK